MSKQNRMFVIMEKCNGMISFPQTFAHKEMTTARKDLRFYRETNHSGLRCTYSILELIPVRKQKKGGKKK